MTRILPTLRALGRYIAARVDPLTQAALLLPLFIVYHVGVVAQVRRAPDGGMQWVGNGVDFLTGTALALVRGDVTSYLLGAIGVSLALTALLLGARRGRRVAPEMFLPLLAESAAYAVLTAGLVGFVVDAVGLGVLDGAGLFNQVVSSCGAGLHEELVFRLGLFHGGSALLARVSRRPVASWVLVGALTSALFAAVHYLGPLGDDFTPTSFGLRLLLGAVFAGVYRARGIAVAAWTHALYDVLYFVLRRL